MRDRPLSILMTADTVGGVWSYCLELVQSKPWRNISVCLATMGPSPSRAQAAEAAQVPNLYLIEKACKLEWMDNPWTDVELAGEWLLSLEESLSPDIIHLNGYAHGLLPFRAPKVVVAHSCVLSWWEAVKHEAAPLKWDRYRHAVRDGLNAADAIVAPSAAMLDCVDRFYGPLVNARAIHNGCDASAFRRGTKERFILAAGRVWDEAKNIGALAAIAPTLDWPVYLAGENKEPDCNSKPYATNGLTCLGKLSRANLADWYSRASIYALPARYEPFGLSVLEAAISSCALVLGDIPSLRELWEDAALFVSADDPEHLKFALKQLIRDPQQLGELSSASVTRAFDYSTDAMGKEYLDLYRSLLPQSKIQAPEFAVCA